MSEHPNYPYSYPLKMSIWISVFVFDFNMDVKRMHPNPTEHFSLSDSIFVFEKYPIASVFIRIRKEKVTSETILNLSLYLIT